MEQQQDETVTLVIQETPLVCSRVDLIQHSDYFRAMFEGNFIESCKNIIPLNGVDLDAMKIIMKLLWDSEYIVDEENILSVLQAACMLQFLQVKNTCLSQLLNMLSVDNCLKIWIYTEHLDLQEISSKAKLKALLEFVRVKDTYSFLQLTLDDVCKYLGNINLQCVDERQVFESAIKWFENSGEQSAEVLLKLLFCVDFSGLELGVLDEFSMNENISKFEVINDILECTKTLKKSGACDNVNACNLLKSKRRNFDGQPCILMENLDFPSTSSTVLHSDNNNNFKCNRKYGLVDSSSAYSAVSFDVNKRSFRKLFEIERFRCVNLNGFKIIGYKQFVFLYGGEFLLGKGTWNTDFYIYDTITKKWVKKKFPFCRRHFECCICGKYLFIIGDTGRYRVIQKNLFWYDIEEDVWSEEVDFPSPASQIKCCNVNNELVFLDLDNNNGYIFCTNTKTWRDLVIRDSFNVLLSDSERLTLFSYKNNIYIRSLNYCNQYKLFILKIENDQVVVLDYKHLNLLDELVSGGESIVWDNVLCSFIRYLQSEVKEPILIELFNIDTYEYNGETTKDILEINGEKFKFLNILNLFSVFHSNLLERGDERVNAFP